MFIGKIDENIGSLVYGNLFKIFGNNWNCYLGNPCYIFKLSNTNQYLFENFIFFLSFRFDAIFIMNLFMILTLFISVFVFYKFYLNLIQNKFISILLAILLTSSPYFSYQLSLHYELSNIWISILILHLILKAKNSLTFVFIGLLLGSLIGISNYIYVFFNIILFVFLIASFMLVKKYPSDENFEYLKIKNIIFMYSTSLFISILLMIPFLTRESNPDQLESYSRNVNNFIIFSSRPWYFFLPAEDNPFYGKLTKEFINYLKNTSQNYLFNNYFKSEHSASFFGITNFLLSILGFIYILKNKNFKNRFIYYSFLVTFILCVLLSLPPLIVIAGKNIYLPSYLIYSIFPMFRVLSRFGVYSTAIILIFSGYGLIYLKNKLQRLGLFLILIIFTSALSEFFMRINLTIYDKPHPSLDWIHKNTPNNSILAVYPLEKSRITMFWLPDIQRKLINPSDFKSEISRFDSEKFTKSLLTKEGLEDAKRNNVSYLIVFSDNISEKDQEFFNNNDLLNLEYESNGIKTQSNVCLKLTFIFNCRDISNLGQIKIYKIR